MLHDKYFLRHDFLKIYLRKIQIDFIFFMILYGIDKEVYLCLFEHKIQENMFKSITAHFWGFFLVF